MWTWPSSATPEASDSPPHPAELSRATWNWPESPIGDARKGSHPPLVFRERPTEARLGTGSAISPPSVRAESHLTPRTSMPCGHSEPPSTTPSASPSSREGLARSPSGQQELECDGQLPHYDSVDNGQEPARRSLGLRAWARTNRHNARTTRPWSRGDSLRPERTRPSTTSPGPMMLAAAATTGATAPDSTSSRATRSLRPLSTSSGTDLSNLASHGALTAAARLIVMYC